MDNARAPRAMLQNRSMRRSGSLPERLLEGPFTLSQARDAGVSKRRTRARDLAIPCRGVRRSAGGDDSLLERVRALVAITGAVASHLTAAALWGFPLPLSLQDHAVIHLTHRKGHRAVRRVGVCGHQSDLRGDEVTQGRFIACTSPLRTWFDLALILDEDDLVIAGDHLLRRQNPYASPKELDKYLASRQGCAGYRKAMCARNRMRTGTDSAKETEVRLLLIKHGLPEPGINLPIFDGTGRWIQDPDMSYEELKIAIQYDGGHHASPVQRRRDITRDEDALELGWRVVRLTQVDLDSCEHGGEPRAVARVRRALKERGWTEPKQR